MAFNLYADIGGRAIADIDAPELLAALRWRVTAHTELKRMEEPAPQLSPALDTVESFLAGLFLRHT